MRRSGAAALLAVVLIAGSAGLWLLWAENEYRDWTGCPWGAHIKGLPSGHPVLLGLGLSVGSALIMALARWKQTSRSSAAGLGALTGIGAGLVILVVAFFFGAGLQCTG
jgi:hypothetical protein